MTIYDFEGNIPEIHESVFVAEDANIIGKIKLSEKSSVWFCSTLRGDNELISVGVGSNIQENCVLHTDIGFPLTIGKNCTIGHKAMLHGCTIGDNTLIGMGATILNGAQIGKNCLVGAGALITEGKSIPDGSMVLGMPGKVVKELDEDAINGLLKSAENYQANAVRFMKSLNVIEV